MQTDSQMPWRAIGERIRSAVITDTPLVLNGDELRSLVSVGMLELVAKQEAIEIEQALRQLPAVEAFPDTFSVSLLAKRWGVSTSAIYSLIKSGQIASFRFGEKLYRIKCDAVFDYENNHGGRAEVAEAIRHRRSPSPRRDGQKALELAFDDARDLAVER